MPISSRLNAILAYVLVSALVGFVVFDGPRIIPFVCSIALCAQWLFFKPTPTAESLLQIPVPRPQSWAIIAFFSAGRGFANYQTRDRG